MSPAGAGWQPGCAAADVVLLPGVAVMVVDRLPAAVVSGPAGSASPAAACVVAGGAAGAVVVCGPATDGPAADVPDAGGSDEDAGPPAEDAAPGPVPDAPAAGADVLSGADALSGADVLSGAAGAAAVPGLVAVVDAVCDEAEVSLWLAPGAVVAASAAWATAEVAAVTPA